MRTDPTRLVADTQAPGVLPALLDAAQAGRATHIVHDKTVVAHLVPAGALVLDTGIEEALLGAVVGAEAERFAGEIEKHGYQHPGNTVGQLMGWLWESSGDATLRWLGRYATDLSDALAVRRIARPPFEALFKAVRTALAPNLTGDAIGEFETTARGRLAEFTDLFGAAELAGHGRQRDPDDPWPDTTAAGRSFAKKRWSDIRVGDFVPRQPGAELDYDDAWCRVERLDATDVLLRDADGQDVTAPAPDRVQWLPVRGREPWQWGLPP